MERSHLMETPTSFSGELTRPNSDASSLTVDDSKDNFQLSGNANPHNCTDWTNKKHNLYLNCLEASFVKQLHQSMGFPAWCSEQNKNAGNLSTKQPVNFVSKQFTVMQKGCNQEINSGKITVVRLNDVVKSPWIEHSKRASRPLSTGPVDCQECCRIRREENSEGEERMSSNRLGRYTVNHAYGGDSVRSVAEGSGQNFLDNDCEVDSRPQTKMLKMSSADDSSDNDQIVLSGKLQAKDIPAV